ncbi:MAG: hypothetical protein MUO31_05410 [Thermodesulfovibrionales bacterium]|nr:hypothetical protein [Thermodesulfovibrionales bacterium]
MNRPDKYPHIVSWLDVKVRLADPVADFYVPPVLRQQNRGIVVTVDVTKKVCDKISCNFAHPSGECTKETSVLRYRVGDLDRFELACQPACFNLLNNPTFDENDKEYPHMSRVVHNNGNCVFVPGGVMWSELPLFRSTEKFETRVNDLPHGFDYKFNEFSASGYGGTYNKSYCDSFFDQYDEKKKVCTTPLWMLPLNAVVGENVIKMAKAGVNSIINNGNPIPWPNHPPPPIVEAEFQLEGWLSDINPDFKLYDPDGDYPAQQVYPDVQLGPLVSVVESALEKIRARISLFKLNAGDISTEQRISMESMHYTQKTPTASTAADPADFVNQQIFDGEKWWGDTMYEVFFGIIGELLTDPMFLASLGFDFLSDKFVSAIQKGAKDGLAKISKALAVKIASLGKSVSSKVLAVSIRTTVARTMTHITLKVASTLILALGKIVALASSVIGIVLIIVSLLDIVFMFWDPLGIQNKYPPGYIDEVLFYTDAALRQQFQMSIPRVNFDVLSMITMSQEEIITLNIGSLEWVFEYFDALEVNSEGSRIDRGPDIEFDLPATDIESELDRLHTRTQLWTPRQFSDFEAKHTDRWNLSKAMQILGTGVFAIAILFVILQSHLAAFIVLILSVLIIFISLFNLEGDVLIDNLPRPAMRRFFDFVRI